MAARPFLSLGRRGGGGGGREDSELGVWGGEGRAARDLRDVGWGSSWWPWNLVSLVVEVGSSSSLTLVLGRDRVVEKHVPCLRTLLDDY